MAMMLTNILSMRIAYIVLRHSSTTAIPRCYAISNSLNEKSSDSEMLERLRMAVSPSYGLGSNTYETQAKSTCSSALAGDPKRLRTCQDIRAEILEKWNKRPRPDVQREWMKNTMFN